MTFGVDVYTLCASKTGQGERGSAGCQEMFGDGTIPKGIGES